MYGCPGGVWLFGGACMVALGGMRGCLWGGIYGFSRGHVWLLLGGHKWDTTRYGDTINERVVRILLECILVTKVVSYPDLPCVKTLIEKQ